MSSFLGGGAGGGGGGGLVINTTPISGGQAGMFLADNGGILIEATAHFPPATSNIDFYVNPITGSDSNPGTIGSPYATIPHAVQQAARYDWQFLFGPNIHLADGTYPPVGSINLGSFVNLFQQITFLGNNAFPQNIVLADQFAMDSPNLIAIVGGLSFTGVANSCFDNINGTFIVDHPVIFNDNSTTPFFNQGFSFFFVATTLTFTGSHINWFSFNGPGVAWFQACTINFPATINMDQAFTEVDGVLGNSSIGVAGLVLINPTFTNFGGVTGTSLLSFSPGYINTKNGDVSDLPGTNNGFIVSDTFLTGGNKEGKFFINKSGPPAATDVPVGGWRVLRDSNIGVMYAVANDAGTIKPITGGLIPAPGNLTFYISTTGSDSNSGTLAAPFATFQHAVNFATQFNYQANFGVTFQFADGTYSVAASQANFGDMFNCLPGITIKGHVGNASLVVVQDCNWQIDAPHLSVIIGWLTFNCDAGAAGSCVNGVQGQIAIFGDLIFTGTSIPFYNEGPAITVFEGINITVTAASMQRFLYMGPGIAWFETGSNKINLPPTLTVSDAFIELHGFLDQSTIGVTELRAGTLSWTNFAGVVGVNVIADQSAFILTQTGELSDFPGSLPPVLDNTVVISGFNAKKGQTGKSKAGLPAVADLSLSTWSVMKDTSGGGVYLAYNDAGTVKSVPLGGLSATITTAKLTVGGAQGSMTFVDGVLTAQTQAT